ncbi:MAG: tRNA epoxyqueuosine(34) reductase QueG [Bacteroidales bacterium]|nr:tRNA epoxyqueuosine(34) reductase QueG [Bacteroidales bacterium]
MLPGKVSEIIRQAASASRFDLCGIARAEELIPEGERLMSWLADGMNAGMDYMNRNTGKRINPALLVPGAKTVVVVALNYYPGNSNHSESFPVISRYATGADYHVVMKERLGEMMKRLQTLIPGLEGRVFTDSAPVMEKALAVRAGLGSQGRNSLLIVRGRGSYFFLGELIINAVAEYDEPSSFDPCVGCSRCVDACPTAAISAGGFLEAGRCISYLTVEHRGDMPSQFQGRLNNRVFGCDICQDVCPHNSGSRKHSVPEFLLSEERMKMTQDDWEKLTPEKFVRLFRGSTVERTGYDRFVRNLMFARTL